MNRFSWAIGFLLLSISCSNKYESKSCGENPGHGNLFVFIGKKISVKEFPSEDWDAKFLARYEVLERICGTFKKDTIEFTVFDHYGDPPFSKYENVMLFVADWNGKFIHEKYQFVNVYKTRDGRWASPSSWSDQYFGSNIKPEKLDFEREVAVDITGQKKQIIKRYFPSPYYRIANNKAIAEYGNYAEDIFTLKKRGVLSARGLFGENDEIETINTTLGEMVRSEKVKLASKEYNLIRKKWNKFLNFIQLQNDRELKQNSFDSVICSVCEGFSSTDFYNDLEPIDSFIASSFRYFPGSTQWNTIKSKEFNISATKYFDSRNDYSRLNLPDSFIVYNIEIVKENKIEKKVVSNDLYTFSFIKVGDSLKFYGMTSGVPVF